MKLKKLLGWFLIAIFFVSGSLSGAIKASASTLPDLSFEKTTAIGPESISIIPIKITLSEDSNEDVSVSYEVSGTAIKNKDYVLDDGSVEIPAGKLEAEIKLVVLNDSVVEVNKDVVVQLIDPEYAQLGASTKFTYTISDDDSSMTFITTAPNLPDGLSSWFISTPEITLESTDPTAEISYQWNKTSGVWQKYADSFAALEGENILYYRSTDSLGNAEKTKWLLVKVDTVAPIMSAVKLTLNDKGQVVLSWKKVSGATSYQITKDGKLLGTTKNLNFTDSKAITAGKLYQYKVSAVDIAGNVSKAKLVKIQTPKTEVVKEVSGVSTVASTTTTVTPEVKVAPTIGSGRSIAYTPTPKVAPKVAQTPEKTDENKSTDTKEKEPENQRNWNKLLLAISILIIAAGAAIGGYYGYEWWVARKDESSNDENPKSKSRW